MSVIENGTPEFRSSSNGTITLYLGERSCPPFGQSADVRNARTRELRQTIVAALEAALRLGVEHGPCNQQREIENCLLGRLTPSHVAWHSVRTESGWEVYQTADGERSKIILRGRAPFYTAADVVNALERAFTIGGTLTAISSPGEAGAS